jgi:hypothetical protein
MVDPELAPLAGWGNFYVIVGSSGAALIGLQFVVIALVAEVRARSSHDQIGAYATPTIMHLAATLLVSTLMSAPWRALGPLAWTLRVVGVAGVSYEAIILKRARRQQGYQPVFEDWLWHTILPFAAYAGLFVAAVLLRTREGGALFMIAGMALSLLLVAIHNAWDTVVYIVVDRHVEPTPPPDK